MASKQLVETHSRAWPLERIHRQKHKLTAVPVFEIGYGGNIESGRFWVFGKNHLVWSQDYPAQVRSFLTILNLNLSVILWQQPCHF